MRGTASGSATLRHSPLWSIEASIFRDLDPQSHTHCCRRLLSWHNMADPSSTSIPPPYPTTTTTTSDPTPSYGGFTRFELELEFVQSLSNPFYLNHLASQHLFQDPAFVAYLDYLQYFIQPEYLRFLNYPGPTLKALELLQQERFRTEILSPDLANALANEWVEESQGTQSWMENLIRKG